MPWAWIDTVQTCPFSRRGLFAGLAAAGAVTISTRTHGVPVQQPVQFYGPHQAGIADPPPTAGLVVAFDVLATSRPDLERLFRTLTTRIAFLTHGGRVPERDPKLPPADSGLLGPEIRPQGLTVTVSVGASLFDDRFDLASLRPRHLTRMPRFPNDQLDASLCHGDLLLQICGNSPDVTLHALRDIIKNTPDLLSPRWKVEGFLPSRAVDETPRNLMGFKDGTANLNGADAAVMDRYVWVDPAREIEAGWTKGGSYQVVRVIRMLVERWDRTPLGEQQAIFGRDKVIGAPLGMTDEHDKPNYQIDPEGKTIPVDAHIRLANPRTPETEANLILRRPYNYSRGLTRAGQMDVGLLFVCYQADLWAGFVSVQDRLNGEPLEEYIKPIGGGYFFVLPGVPGPGHYLGENLLTTKSG